MTGANGFVGQALVPRLADDGHHVIALTRRHAATPLRAAEVVIGDLETLDDWAGSLAGAHAVVHLAARVHVMHDPESDPLAAFRRTNVEATLRLAREAASRGIRRVVFLSSVKVNGESGRFDEEDVAAPEDPYGVSKLEAEQGLRVIAASTGLEVVIVRPPLIYGPGVRANFAALMQAVRRGIPLPLGAVDNRRSLVALDNLVDFIATCLTHPAAANETFLVSDGEDLSTSELIRRLAAAMGRKPRLVPIPGALLYLAARLIGRQGEARRLLSSLQVDIGKARRLLGWAPPLSVDEALRRAVPGGHQ